MKLDYLQFLELEVFTKFGSKLEAGMAERIKKGQLLRELLRQERLAPMPIEQQLAWLVAYNEGLIDNKYLHDTGKIMTKLPGLSLSESRENWLADVKSALEAQ